MPKDISDENRLEKGPAYNEEITAAKPKDTDWPTYRHDITRSGRSPSEVSANLKPGWKTKIGGRLSAVSIADGKLYVAQVDAHTLYALDEKTGKELWQYTAGGRIDSPPTIYEGRAIFGSADGWVYCLRADTGELIWRFRGAPQDRRMMAFDQLESVWPVHGNILVRDGIAWFVAGRSNYLDSGLRLYRLNPKTGEKLTEVVIDERDPETGENLQKRLQTLQMPTGLADILSGDDKHVYMRSQRFDLTGKREDLGPHSGNTAIQGGTQRGEGVHLFSPTGFMDDTYFHRSYWVYGRSFAGGHNGYYQAGKFAPAGRLLAFDEASVYGFGRKPEYLKWTTTMEHQLFATSKVPPEVPESTPASRRGKGQAAGTASTTVVRIKNSPSLDPANKPLTVEAWVKSEKPNGVVLARGGPQSGYALLFQGGKPQFILRTGGKLFTAAAEKRNVNKWVHLVGTLGEDKTLKLYVDGKLAGSTEVSGLIPAEPQAGHGNRGRRRRGGGRISKPASVRGSDRRSPHLSRRAVGRRRESAVRQTGRARANRTLWFWRVPSTKAGPRTARARRTTASSPGRPPWKARSPRALNSTARPAEGTPPEANSSLAASSSVLGTATFR